MTDSRSHSLLASNIPWGLPNLKGSTLPPHHSAELISKSSCNVLPQCLWGPFGKEGSVWGQHYQWQVPRKAGPPYLFRSHNRPPVCSSYHCVCSLHSWTSTPWQPHQNSSGSLPNSLPADNNLWKEDKSFSSCLGPLLSPWTCLGRVKVWQALRCDKECRCSAIPTKALFALGQGLSNVKTGRPWPLHWLLLSPALLPCQPGWPKDAVTSIIETLLALELLRKFSGQTQKTKRVHGLVLEAARKGFFDDCTLLLSQAGNVKSDNRVETAATKGVGNILSLLGRR